MAGKGWTPIAAMAGLGACVLLGLAAQPAAVEASRAADTNVLLILTDDQRLGTMEVMPATRRFFRSGTEFARAHTTTPQCCPSRVSLFTGQYVHNHHVESNEDARQFDPSESWPRLLNRNGYRTGFFGKYLNKISSKQPVPNFDRSFVGFDSDHRQNSVSSSEFIVDKANDFLKDLEGKDADAWAIQLSLRAPHIPIKYPKRYDDFDVPPWQPNPAVAEENLSDKHPDLALVQTSVERSKRLRKGQLRMLAAADDALRGLYESLDKKDELDSTLVIFMSDNGFYWNEHGLSGKVLPYLDSLRVPMYMRGPGVPNGVDERIVANIDVAPTILDAADVPADYKIDGYSLFEPLARDWLLVEGPAEAKDSDIPQWRRGYLSASTHYFEWKGGRREYYDLTADPWELKNLLGDGNPRNDPEDEEAIAASVKDAAGCAGASCP